MDSLQVSYRDWLFSCQLRDLLENYGKSVSDVGFACLNSCLERWILAFVNVRTTASIFSADIEANWSIFEKYLDELQSKCGKYTAKDSELKYLQDTVTKLKDFQNGKEIEVTISQPEQFNISYRDYRDYYPPERLSLLYKMSPSAANLIDICLRYSSLSLGGQQFSIPQEFADAIYEHLNVTNEGFASPFNSKFIDKEDARYCSLFPEIEKVYKSQGSFFDTELIGNWEINPPFIESVLDRVADRVIQRLTTTTEYQVFVVIFPHWVDASGFQKLEKLSEVGYLKRLTIKKFLEYHYDTPWGNKIRANFNSAIFFISNDPEISQENIQRCLDSWN